MNPLTLTDSRFEIPDSRMTEAVASSLCSGIWNGWNLESEPDKISGSLNHRSADPGVRAEGKAWRNTRGRLARRPRSVKVTGERQGLSAVPSTPALPLPSPADDTPRGHLTIALKK
jgi:hypothetical protein